MNAETFNLLIYMRIYLCTFQYVYLFCLSLSLSLFPFFYFKFRFHFPFGKPLPSIALEQTLSRLSAAFDAYPNNAMSKDDFVCVLKICSLPFYWRMPLFNCTQLTSAGLVDGKRFCDFWKQ